MSDHYVYSACCTWHGPISAVAHTTSRLPCCPHCGSVLYQFDSPAEWWEPAEQYELGTGPKAVRPHPGYVAMLKWQAEQGLCFPVTRALTGIRELRDAFEKATGTHVPLDSDFDPHPENKGGKDAR